MNEPHRIRLRGPWQATALESFDAQLPLPQPVRMQVPCSWSEGGWPGFRGRAVHSRPFGKPTGLGAGERARLVIEPIAGAGVVRLNREVLGDIGGESVFDCDVTERLQARNLLEIELVADGDWAGVTGEVRLEIHLA